MSSSSVKRIIIGFSHNGDNDLITRSMGRKPPYGHLTPQGKERVQKLQESLKELCPEGLGRIAAFAMSESFSADSACELLEEHARRKQVAEWRPFRRPMDLPMHMSSVPDNTETIVLFLPLHKVDYQGDANPVLDLFVDYAGLFGFRAPQFQLSPGDENNLTALVVDLEKRTVARLLHDILP
jgi:hypothetical protein